MDRGGGQSTSVASDPEEMSVTRATEGGFLSLAQPSGFLFVGIGPVGGTSFPFESVDGVVERRTVLQRQSYPPLLAPVASASSIESEPTMDRWSTARREAKP